MIESLIGHTPLLQLMRVVEPGMADVFVKLEGQNPGGSIKDRTALGLIEDAERRGVLHPGGTIVEPTSGNTGIGLAQVAAAKGYKLILCMPASMSEERKRTLVAYGAELILTDPTRRMLAAIEEAEKLVQERGAVMMNQFGNPANPAVHERTTGPELWEQMDGRIDAFVYGSGTGGTISGVGRYLRRMNPAVQIIACGTSFHAGMVARYWIEQYARLPVQVEIASEYRYRDVVPDHRALVVTISQSGETADTLAALEFARSIGQGNTLAICNSSESSLRSEEHTSELQSH